MGPCRWETDFPLSCSPSGGSWPKRVASGVLLHTALEGEVGTSIFPTLLADAPTASTRDARASVGPAPAARAGSVYSCRSPARKPDYEAAASRAPPQVPTRFPPGLRTELAPLKAEARAPLLDRSCSSAGAAGRHVGGHVGGLSTARRRLRAQPRPSPGRAVRACAAGGASCPPQRGGAGDLPPTQTPPASLPPLPTSLHPRPAPASLLPPPTSLHPRPAPASLLPPPTSLPPRSRRPPSHPRPPPPSLGARDRLGTLGPRPST
ncbi:uncharacterized protein LOC117976655 [Pan paniscus]|uniref:uncharacterized protein LOC117976655 n=1 Tax=Pan paniscus TaxID=9597 RepID=UPI003007DB4C